MEKKEIAMLLKVSVQAVAYWEAGERMPSYENLLRLADLLQTSTDELLGRGVQSEQTKKPGQGISLAEQQLIKDFRSLNQQGKEYILQTMAMATKIYKQSDAVSGLESQA